MECTDERKPCELQAHGVLPSLWREPRQLASMLSTTPRGAPGHTQERGVQAAVPANHFSESLQILTIGQAQGCYSHLFGDKLFSKILTSAPWFLM